LLNDQTVFSWAQESVVKLAVLYIAGVLCDVYYDLKAEAAGLELD